MKPIEQLLVGFVLATALACFLLVLLVISKKKPKKLKDAELEVKTAKLQSEAEQHRLQATQAKERGANTLLNAVNNQIAAEEQTEELLFWQQTNEQTRERLKRSGIVLQQTQLPALPLSKSKKVLLWAGMTFVVVSLIALLAISFLKELKIIG